jgi:hypothetical protein
MNEDALLIFDYLPLNYKSIQEEEYIQFLWDSFSSNYENAKYQFAYITYHMLFMSTIYYKIWQIKFFKKEDFEKALIGFHKDTEKELIDSDSAFTFSKINESNIFRFLKLLGCNNSDVGCYTKLVKDRNDVAHSNGNIFYSDQKSIDDKISEMLQLLERLQKYYEKTIQDSFIKFLDENSNIDNWEFSDSEEQVDQMLINKSKLSKQDVHFCLNCDLTTYTNEANLELIKKVKEKIDSN